MVGSVTEVRFPAEAEIFLFAAASRPLSELAQSPVKWIPRALSSGVQWPGLKARDSPPSSWEVRNAWNYTSTLPYVFMEWCSVKPRDNFTILSYDIMSVCPSHS
jgi:hypothetical protein